MAELTAGQKAARTRLARHGTDGLRDIALRALATRRANRDRLERELERHLAVCAAGAMSRARRRGLPCDDDLAVRMLERMEAQRYCCGLSGVPFSLDRLGSGAAPRPYAPSIDRIDARLGYTEGNVRVICWATNCLLGTWGDPVAVRIASGITARTGD